MGLLKYPIIAKLKLVQGMAENTKKYQSLKTKSRDSKPKTKRNESEMFPLRTRTCVNLCKRKGHWQGG